MYSEQDLRHAAEFRDEIHREALAGVRAVYPAAADVVDPYPAEAYFQKVWDYPGKWYTVVAVPEGFGSRKALVETIIRNTLEHCRDMGNEPADDSFDRLIAAYPDNVCDYCIITKADRFTDAENPFPYRGPGSHRLALGIAARELFAEGGEWTYDLKQARCRRISGKALFAPVNSDDWLNYRKAFLCPPYGNNYTDRDFDRFNAVLFPGGADGLEVFKWTTDWSEYFDDGREWWGALCLTVYDRTLDRFTVIMASATD